MTKYDRADVERRLADGLEAGAFPGAVIMWGSPESPQTSCGGFRGLSRNRLAVDESLIYDLASLTKLLATTSLAMIENAHGRLDLQRPLADGPLSHYLKNQAWKHITPEHLLAHQSGLPAWRAFHRLPQGTAGERRQMVLEAIDLEGPEYQPAYKTIYSDLNFMLLGFLLEETEGKNLNDIFDELVAKPLGISGRGLTEKPLTPPENFLGYLPSGSLLAPTEDGFRWGGPIGNREGGFRGPVPLGRPHDDNASYLHSVAGHAGLFGSAKAVWTLAAQWSATLNNKDSIFEKESLEKFLRVRPTACDTGRPLGFNLLNRMESLKSSTLSPDSFGHTGYTGPALWWNLETDFIWLLMCNRVHPKAMNKGWQASAYQAGL